MNDTLSTLAALGVDPFAPEALHPVVDPNVREWRLVIPGEPVAKGRPKFRQIKTATKDFVSTYTPKKTARYEDRVRYAAQQEWNRPLLRDTAISACIFAYRSIPSSFSRLKTQAAILGTVRPITRPDFDNYAKIAVDALNEIVYADDSAIVDCFARKFYSLNPRMEIVLTW